MIYVYLFVKGIRLLYAVELFTGGGTASYPVELLYAVELFTGDVSKAEVYSMKISGALNV
jgi:hypothetical protein